MLDKLPLKKDHLLIIGVVILLVLSYNFAFKTTIIALQANSQLKKQITQNTDLSYQPDYLQRKDSNLNKIIALYKVDTLNFRNNSISTISIIAEKESVKLSELPSQDPFFHTDKFIIQKFSLEGNYFALTKTLNAIQATNDIGVIRSVIYKVTRGNTNTPYDRKLIAEVYLEIAK